MRVTDDQAGSAQPPAAASRAAAGAAAPVSYLFVPGNRPERFDKAMAAGADAVIIDLEDAVPAAQRAAAREAIAAWHARQAGDGARAASAGGAGPASAAQPRRYVRINAADSADHDADLALVRALPDVGVVLPKAESAEAAARAALAGAPRPPLVAIIESVAGFDALDAIARAPGLGRLAFGALDYAVDLGASGDVEALLVPMTMLAHAARRAGLAAPVAGVTAALDDAARLAEDVRLARAFGFAGKLCIHPRQVAAVHAAFAPSPAEADWARRVLAAVAGGAAAAQVDGAMVDRPVVLRAQSILARAGRHARTPSI